MTDPQQECTCTPLQVQRYRSKVSGPLLDRIDIQIEVPGLRYHTVQQQRFQKTKIHANAQMGAKEIKRYCAVKEDAERLLETAINKLGLSARAYSRC